MQKLNLAVAGLAHGWKFVDAINKMEDVNLAALCGASGEPHHRAAVLQPSIPYFQGYESLLEAMGSRLDGIIAALPNDIHLEVTRHAARLNLPVLMEKPVAGTLEEAEEIITLVRENKLKYLVGHHRRFSAKLRLAKKICDDGLLGRLLGASVIWAAKKPDDYYTRPWRVKKGSGGPLLINAIHDVDDLRFVLGEIESVQSSVSNLSRGNPVEDLGAAFFRFKNGALATLFMTDASPSIWFYEACAQEDPFFHPSSKDCYFFFGDRGSLAFPSMELITYDAEKHGEGWHRPYHREIFPVPRVNPIEEETRHFCEMIRKGTSPLVSAEDATVTLEVIKALEESSEQGRLVTIN